VSVERRRLGGSRLFGIVVKAFLNFLRQFSEINLRDPRFALDHDAVRLDAGDRRVFVFFPGSRFEVIGECE